MPASAGAAGRVLCSQQLHKPPAAGRALSGAGSCTTLCPNPATFWALLAAASMGAFSLIPRLRLLVCSLPALRTLSLLPGNAQLCSNASVPALVEDAANGLFTLRPCKTRRLPMHVAPTQSARRSA